MIHERENRKAVIQKRAGKKNKDLSADPKFNIAEGPSGAQRDQDSVASGSKRQEVRTNSMLNNPNNGPASTEDGNEFRQFKSIPAK